MTGWAIFLLGLFLGGTLGVLLLSALVVAGESEESKRANFLEQFGDDPGPEEEMPEYGWTEDQHK